MLCYVMLCYVLLYYIILYYITLCYIVLYYITLYYIMLYYIILFYNVLYYIMLYYTILHYIVQRQYTCIYQSCREAILIKIYKLEKTNPNENAVSHTPDTSDCVAVFISLFSSLVSLLTKLSHY